MIPFVDTAVIPTSFLENDPEEATEAITGDNTIGILRAEYGEHIGGDARFHVRRLRRAVLAFEEHFGDSTLEIAIVEIPVESSRLGPVLALTPVEGSSEAIVLAPFAHEGDVKSDRDQLIELYGEGSHA